MIIGLCGLKQSGKDTVAAHLVKDYGYERRAFADPLKKSVAALFDIPFVEVDKFKNDDLVEVVIQHAPIDTVHEYRRFTFREFLQRFGTEAHRDVPEMGYDFWVDLTLPVQGYYEGRDLVVTDVRFENEARRIRYLKGVIIEVSRAGLVNQDPHRSEKLEGIDPDYTMFNNGTFEDLETSIHVMMEHLDQKVVH